MKTSDKCFSLSFIVATLVLTACATQGTKTGDTSAKVPEAHLGLTYSQAESLFKDGGPSLVSAAKTRRAEDQYISAIRFQLRRPDGAVKGRTLMTMRPMRNGLQYFSHTMLDPSDEGVNESGVNLFGIGSIAYWVSIGPPSPRVAKSLELRAGRMFRTDGSFTLWIAEGDGALTETSCRSIARSEARLYHPDLRGEAGEFACTDATGSEEPSKRVVLYLDRYGQYVPHLNFDLDGNLATRFEITSVSISGVAE